jgi:LasA protease
MPALATPPLSASHIGLPWKIGESATFIAGPHHNLRHTCGGRAPACNSLDFAPSSGVVRAARAGEVHFPYCGPKHKLVVIDHGGGWFTGYYHMAAPIVKPGQFVDGGDELGKIGEDLSCGGTAAGKHVHFFVKYVPGCESATARSEICYKKLGDPFLNTKVDVPLDGGELGGWQVTGILGNSCMTHVSPADKRCEGEQVMNYGGTSPVPGLPTQRDVQHQLSVRPAVVGYTGDGSGWLGGFDGDGINDQFGHMNWTSWTSVAATGTGAAWINNCEPSCAGGTFSAHAVGVRAYAPRSGFFTRLTLRFDYNGDAITDERGVRRLVEHVGGRAIVVYSYYIVHETATPLSGR